MLKVDNVKYAKIYNIHNNNNNLYKIKKKTFWFC